MKELITLHMITCHQQLVTPKPTISGLLGGKVIYHHEAKDTSSSPWLACAAGSDGHNRASGQGPLTTRQLDLNSVLLAPHTWWLHPKKKKNGVKSVVDHANITSQCLFLNFLHM